MSVGKTVLLIGSGGREHAMAWKLSCSPQLSKLIVAPGGDGMPEKWERWKLPVGSRADFEVIARRAKESGVDFAVIGPDNPLADGIVDVFEAFGIPTMGPTAAAARIESSKMFAKEIMRRAGVPTAAYRSFESLGHARSFVENADWSRGWVLKADGLAYGKGVQVCSTQAEALQALDVIASLGSASSRLLIEEKVEGEEISWFALCSGTDCVLLEPARDYKRIYDGGRGPNTGGMGAFSPVPGIPTGFAEKVRTQVFLPTLHEMARSGCQFKGILYAGLMVDFVSGKHNVLEFNCRFGDPEAQVVLTRMEDDFLPWCESIARGKLDSAKKIRFSSESAVIVIAAAKGYPDAPELGAEIDPAGRELLQAPRYFNAGIRADGPRWFTSGGRVFGAMGSGKTLARAREQAYDRMAAVKFSGIYYRSDIAQ